MRNQIEEQDWVDKIKNKVRNNTGKQYWEAMLGNNVGKHNWEAILGSAAQAVAHSSRDLHWRLYKLGV